MKNPYEALGVTKAATQDEIKKAYRDLAKKLHPDLNPGNKSAEGKFKDVNSAYEAIGTPEARAKFDRGEAEEAEQARARESYYQTQQEGGRYSRAFDSSELGEDFFANLFGASRPKRPGTPRTDFPGEDHVYHLAVDFKDAALGCEQEVTFSDGKKLTIKIPAGIDSGTRLRVAGRGGSGRGKGAAGDAYLEVTVNPLIGFKRVGNNIESELPISFQEGILGAEVKAATLEGYVVLRIKPGSSSGARLRIKGKGIGSGPERGDQIVTLQVVLPRKLDPELQAAIAAWGGKYDYDPRSQT